MTVPNAVDLATIIGRIVASLRKEMGITQAALAGHMKWDRSVLARIEAGRNTANIDNIFELEEQFMADRLIEGHGDLTKLCALVVHEARRRGLRPVVGHTESPEGEEPVEAPSLDRIVGRIVDDWLEDLKAQPPPARKKRR